MIAIRRYRQLLVIACTTVALLLSRSTHADEPERQRITVSRETTRVTEPVDEAGFVIYAEAIRARNSKGVTPENNAAILVWKAIGPAEIPQEERERFFRSIGIAPLSETKDYFQSEPDARDCYEDFEYHLELAKAAPWSEAKYPKLARWMKANEKPLNLIVEASRRRRFYTPRWAERADDGREPVMMLRLPELQKLREAARALVVRAMLHLEHGQAEESHRDLLACFRIGRLVAEEGFLIAQTVGIAITHMACIAEQKLAQVGRLTADQARRFERDIREVPPMPDLADLMDHCERWSMLDAVTGSLRKGFVLREQLLADLKSSPTVNPEELQAIENRRIDYDGVLRIVNRWYDRWVEALRIPDRPGRVRATAALGDEIMEMKEHIDPGYLLEPGYGADDVTEWMGRSQIVLLFPAVDRVAMARDRVQVRLDETRIAMELAAFHHEHGRYPAELAEIGEHFGEIPQDLFSGEELIYRPLGPGYSLYSVGENGVDNNGESSAQLPEKDDIGVYDVGRQFLHAPVEVPSSYPIFTTEALVSLAISTLMIAVIAFVGLIRRRRMR
jgi:hypothetical protein